MVDVTTAGRYLADQLSETERAEYERWLLAHPEGVQELEAVARLKLGMARLQQRGELKALLPLGANRPARLWWRAPTLAMAASVVALAIGAYFWMAARTALAPLSASLSDLQQSMGRPLRASEALLIMRTRAVEPEIVIAAPPNVDALALSVLPDSGAAGDRYDVRLSRIGRDETATGIARGAGLLANDNGFVIFYVRAALLAPGDYQLVLQNLSPAAQPLQEFRLRVTAEAVATSP